MHVTSLELRQFRSYERLELTPGEGMNVFVGQNAVGKTNLLEALHLCCTARSHRTSRDEEMIRWGQRGGFVRVRTLQRDGTHEISVHLTRERGQKKTVRIAQRQAERIGELFGHVFGVLFSPEDLFLIKGGPSERRRFLDMQLSQLRPDYFYALQRAARALSQRNALLREIEHRPSMKSTLDLWDEQLAEAGATVAAGREQFAGALQELAREEHAFLTDGRERLTLGMVGVASGAPDPKAVLLERLRATRQEDLRRGTTTTGVHRDDLALAINGKDARLYASQGQQRTAVLALKLAQTAFARREKGETPILMLDDVMSELDPERRRQLCARIDTMQTFVTCTDLSDLAGAADGRRYAVHAGGLEPM